MGAKMKSSHLRAVTLAVLLLVSAGAVANAAAPPPAEFPPDAFPSTYQALPAQTTLIQHATIYTGTGERIDDGSVLLRDGKIAAVGKQVEADRKSVV